MKGLVKYWITSTCYRERLFGLKNFDSSKVFVSLLSMGVKLFSNGWMLCAHFLKFFGFQVLGLNILLYVKGLFLRFSVIYLQERKARDLDKDIAIARVEQVRTLF